MVHCGKPSRGCQFCRERRIKCDLLQPECTQCVRAKWQCPGYRDQLELRFRDQNEDVVKRAHGVKPPKESKSQTLVSRVKRPATPNTHKPLARNETSRQIADPNVLDLPQRPERPQNDWFSNETLLPTLQCPVDAQATGFFLSSYVQGSHFDYLPDLYNAINIDEQLSASIHAVSLACFSNEHNASEVMKDARKQYGSALRLTNAALSSPTKAKTDSTLVAVQLLGLFETVTSRSRHPQDSWERHIRGAALLISMRGPEQLHTKLGLRLFKQILESVQVSCVQRAVPIPEELISLCEYVSSFVDPNNTPWRFAMCVIRMASFRATLENGAFTDVGDILDRAEQLDLDLVLMMDEAPEQWQYQTVAVEPNRPLFWSDHFHIYPKPNLAELWNSMRQSRIFINRLIQDQIFKSLDSPSAASISTRSDALLQSTKDTLVTMSNEICASVPQWTEDISQFSQGPSPVPSLADYESPVPTPHLESITSSNLMHYSTRASGYFMLWPLFMVASLPGTSEPLRSWCVNRLRFIGNTKRIPQAFVAADAIDGNVREEKWMHMCHAF